MVELALRGAYDTPENRNRPATVCVACCLSTPDEEKIVYTGLVRRIREGLVTEAQFADWVKKHKESGDVSPAHNDDKGLPPMAAKVLGLLLWRSYAGISSRLFGSDAANHAAVDRKRQQDFDKDWEAKFTMLETT